MDRKTITLNAGPETAPRQIELSVLPPSVSDRRRVAAFNSIFANRRGGDDLANLANVAFQVADVPEEDIAELSSYEQLILGQRLADWIVEGDRPSS